MKIKFHPRGKPSLDTIKGFVNEAIENIRTGGDLGIDGRLGIQEASSEEEVQDRLRHGKRFLDMFQYTLPVTEAEEAALRAMYIGIRDQLNKELGDNLGIDEEKED